MLKCKGENCPMKKSCKRFDPVDLKAWFTSPVRNGICKQYVKLEKKAA